MKEEHSEIIKLLSGFLDKYPDQRFTQALFSLGINEFEEINHEAAHEFHPQLRDVYNDPDEIVLARVKARLTKL